MPYDLTALESVRSACEAVMAACDAYDEADPAPLDEALKGLEDAMMGLQGEAEDEEPAPAGPVKPGTPAFAKAKAAMAKAAFGG